MKITDEQTRNYNLMELHILFQRSIEILDDLKNCDFPLKNNKLNQQLKGVYGPLDKETKKYNDLYAASPEVTTHFYDVIQANCDVIMRNNLLDKSMVIGFLAAHEKDPKAIEGIINKIINK